MPLRLFRSRALSVSSGALALNGAAFLSMFFLTAIYLQQVRGASPLTAGLQFLPMGATAIAGALLATQLVHRLGTRTLQIIGALSACRPAAARGAGATGTYAGELLPGLLLFGRRHHHAGRTRPDLRDLRRRAP